VTCALIARERVVKRVTLEMDSWRPIQHQMICHYLRRIGKDMEGSGRDIFYGNKPSCAWTDWMKPRKIPNKIIGLRDEIRTRNIANKKQGANRSTTTIDVITQEINYATKHNSRTILLPGRLGNIVFPKRWYLLTEILFSESLILTLSALEISKLVYKKQNKHILLKSIVFISNNFNYLRK
jgi:hypothetical protein